MAIFNSFLCVRGYSLATPPQLPRCLLQWELDWKYSSAGTLGVYLSKLLRDWGPGKHWGTVWVNDGECAGVRNTLYDNLYDNPWYTFKWSFVYVWGIPWTIQMGVRFKIFKIVVFFSQKFGWTMASRKNVPLHNAWWREPFSNRPDSSWFRFGLMFRDVSRSNWDTSDCLVLWNITIRVIFPFSWEVH